jgi:hypothetical protein
MAAPDPILNVAPLATAVLQLQACSTAATLVTDWETAARYAITSCQANAIADNDADSVVWVQDNRKFFKNTDATLDYTLGYNGQLFTFENGVAYCAHPNEVDLFVNNAVNLGYNIEEVDYATWFSDNDGTSFYFQ